MDHPLSFVRDALDGLTVIHVHGEVDIATAPAFAEAIAEPEGLIINLASCSYIDSSGLTVLIRKFRNSGQQIPIISPQGSFFRKVVQIAGLGSMFALFETEETARETLEVERLKTSHNEKVIPQAAASDLR